MQWKRLITANVEQGRGEPGERGQLEECPVPGTKLSGFAQAVTSVEIRPDTANKYIKHLSTL